MKNSRGILIVILLSIFTYSNLFATNRYVPTGTGTPSYATIQSAIDNSVTNDIIIVAPNAAPYAPITNFNKDVIVRTTDPFFSNPTQYPKPDPSIAERTIISGSGTQRTVTFSGTRTNSCKLQGFTIREGISTYGGAIYGSSSVNPIIEYNVITYNNATYGGAVAYMGTTSKIQNNTIQNNTANTGGALYKCNGLITNNVIKNNGDALYDCDGTISNNIFSDNEYAIKDDIVLTPVTSLIQGNFFYDNFTAIWGARANIKKNRFYHNSGVEATAIYGDGLDANYNKNTTFRDLGLVIENNLFAYNYYNGADTPVFGGTICYHSGLIQSNTFYNNYAHEYGYAGSLYGCINLNNRNNIFWGTIDCEIWDSPNFCNTNYIQTTGSPVRQNPNFRNVYDYDFHLTANSPYDVQYGGIATISTDFEGETRNSAYSFGADEYYLTTTPSAAASEIFKETNEINIGEWINYPIGSGTPTNDSDIASWNNGSLICGYPIEMSGSYTWLKMNKVGSSPTDKAIEKTIEFFPDAMYILKTNITASGGIGGFRVRVGAFDNTWSATAGYPLVGGPKDYYMVWQPQCSIADAYIAFDHWSENLTGGYVKINECSIYRVPNQLAQSTWNSDLTSWNVDSFDPEGKISKEYNQGIFEYIKLQDVANNAGTFGIMSNLSTIAGRIYRVQYELGQDGEYDTDQIRFRTTEYDNDWRYNLSFTIIDQNDFSLEPYVNEKAINNVYKKYYHYHYANSTYTLLPFLEMLNTGNSGTLKLKSVNVDLLPLITF